MGDLIRRDVIISVLIGPAKRVVPILGYFFIYPIILSHSGVDVLGLWSLLATIASYVSLTDIGFSLLLGREAGKDRLDSETGEIWKDYQVARRSYFILSIIIGLIIISVGPYLFRAFADIYSVSGLIVSSIFLAEGTFIQLCAKLDAAILAAHQDNYIVQIILALAPIFSFSIAIVGALINMPMEGFSVGLFVNGSFQLFVYHWRLSHNHKLWKSAKTSLPWRNSWARFIKLSRRGFHLYLISLGFLLREPIFRLFIALSLGLEAAGIYDIAMRLTSAVRDVITSGFNVLYPSIANLYRLNKVSAVKELLQVSLMLILATGVGGASVLVFSAKIILNLWLGEIPTDLVLATRILSLWTVMTLTNVPFWYLLQAAKHEKVAALSLWFHTGSILLIWVLDKITNFSLITILAYWLLTALITQLYIFWSVEKKLDLFWRVVLHPRMFILAVTSIFFMTIAFLLSSKIAQSIVFRVQGLQAVMGFGIMYMVIVMPIIWKPLRGFTTLWVEEKNIST